jgi:hypothetical protein
MNDSIIVSNIGRIKLDPGDRVVAITWYRDFAIVVTEQGIVYRLVLEAMP